MNQKKELNTTYIAILSILGLIFVSIVIYLSTSNTSTKDFTSNIVKSFSSDSIPNTIEQDIKTIVSATSKINELKCKSDRSRPPHPCNYCEALKALSDTFTCKIDNTTGTANLKAINDGLIKYSIGKSNSLNTSREKKNYFEITASYKDAKKYDNTANAQINEEIKSKIKSFSNSVEVNYHTHNSSIQFDKIFSIKNVKEYN